jgi:ATP-dependent RNA helicase RhlB
MQFSEMNVHPAILQGLTAAAYVHATSVQEKTWQATVIEGRDVTVQSQTGTGKTAAFLIPVFHRILSEGPLFAAKAMILAPTRELAVQIWEEARLLGANTSLRYACVYGGVGYGQQEAMLKSGADILVGTPGRLQDFMDSNKINPKDYSILVIDEADRLLDMGFFPDMIKIIKAMKAPEERFTMLLSATISTRVSQLTWEYMNQPANIVIESDQVTVDNIDQCLYHVSRDEKVSMVLGLLQKEKPDTAIIFCNTKRAAEELAKRLEINNRPAHFIMGDLPQSRRLKIINDLKEKKVPLLVATDVAARGLHVDALDLVINYDVPEDAENYVHRVGRTARAGASGKAITLACERYVFGLEAIEKYIGQKIPVLPVSEDILVSDASKGRKIYLDSWDGGDKDHSRPRRPSAGGHAPRRGVTSEGSSPSAVAKAPAVGTVDPRRRRKQALPAGGSTALSIAQVAGEAASLHASDKPRDPRPPRDRRHKKQEVRHDAAVRPHTGHGDRQKSKDSMEDRLEYYKKKYGESFVLKSGTVSEKDVQNKHPSRSVPVKKEISHVPPVAAKESSSLSNGNGSDKEKKTPRKGIVEWFKSLFRGS